MIEADRENERERAHAHARERMKKKNSDSEGSLHMDNEALLGSGFVGFRLCWV